VLCQKGLSDISTMHPSHGQPIPSSLTRMISPSHQCHLGLAWGPVLRFWGRVIGTHSNDSNAHFSDRCPAPCFW